MAAKAVATGLFGLAVWLAAGAVAASPHADKSKPDGFDLVLSEERSEPCQAGEDCDYLVTVRNAGTRPFLGKVNILRTASYQPRAHKASDDVTCSQKRDSIACRTGDLKLETGDSFSFTLSVTLPRNVGEEVDSCSMVSFRGGELEDPIEDLVAVVQLGLQSHGFYAGSAVDGKPGKNYIAAVNAFRKSRGLDKGEVDPALVKALFGHGGVLAGDIEHGNDEVCETFALPRTAATANQVRGRRIIRRTVVRRTTRTTGFTARDSGTQQGNLRSHGVTQD